MVNRRRSKPHIDGNQKSPLGMGTMLAKFLEDLAVKNFSSETIQKRRCQINEFIRWADARSLEQINQVHRPILQRYQRHLFYYRTKHDKPLSFRTQHVRLSSLRNWFRLADPQTTIFFRTRPVNLNFPRLASACQNTS